MVTQVAFLRAINVGKRRVSMDKLRRPFEDLGYGNVSTFIASGNVIFSASGSASALEHAIEESLEHALGFEVKTFVRSKKQIDKAVGTLPFPTDSDDNVYVGFMKKAASAAAAGGLNDLSNDTDTLTTSGKHIYWFARNGMGGATVSGAAIEKVLEQPTTMRGLRMLKRLQAKLP